MEKLNMQNGERAGDFVKTLVNPETGETGFCDGFHVHKSWARQCMTFDQVMEKAEQYNRERQDIDVELGAIVPTVSDSGRFVLKVNDSEYSPTEWAIKQFSTKIGLTAGNLMVELMSGDTEDAATAVKVFDNHLRKVESSEKEYKIRAYNDGTIRAVLSTRYAPIDNRWFLERINEILPESLYSHWRSDSDTMYGNVLMPDSIIDYGQSDGSDYGGMLSLSNCEIGKRSFGQYPSIFRSICMNGCIWNQKSGEKLARRHIGTIDLEQIAVKMRENITEQIPLIGVHVEKLLRLERFRVEGSMKAHIAAMCDNFKIPASMARMILEEFAVHEKDHRNLFGIVNSFTRACQKGSNEEWVKMDTFAGSVLNWNENQWQATSTKANSMTVEEVENVYGLVGV